MSNTIDTPKTSILTKMLKNANAQNDNPDHVEVTEAEIATALKRFARIAVVTTAAAVTVTMVVKMYINANEKDEISEIENEDV
jgi:hypothetical protein